MMDLEISVTQLRDARLAGTAPKVLDVRELSELEIAAISVDAVIPLGELPARWTELDRDSPWAVLCRSGMRSGQAVAFLRAQGLTEVQNITGGILAWSREVDSTVPNY